MKIKKIIDNKFYKEFQIQTSFKSINKKVETRIVKIAKFFKMPGYKQGKMPDRVFNQMVGKEEAGIQIQKDVSNSIKDLMNEKNITPSFRPNVKISSFDEKNGLIVEVKIDVAPQVPDIKWSNIKIDKIDVKITSKEINQAKNNSLKKYRKFKKSNKDYRAKIGDKVIIDFHGQINNQDFEGSKDKNMEFIIGGNGLFIGFEKELIGCKVNEVKKFDLFFPKNYPQGDIANKKAQFVIKIISLEELEKISHISNKMLKKLGFTSEKNLDEFINKTLNSNLVSAVRIKMKKDLFDKIDKECVFDIPDKMINRDLDVLLEDLKKKINKQKKGGDISGIELKSKYKKIAHRRVKLGLILAAVAKKYEITTNNDEIQEIIEKQANAAPGTKVQILDFYKRTNNLEKLKGPILEEKCVNFILSKINISKVQMTQDAFARNFISNFKKNN